MFTATLPLFDAFGKLETGLVKLDLSPSNASPASGNLGLKPPVRKIDPSEWQEEDAVWKASKIMDQLERFEETKVEPTLRSGTTSTFGEIQPVPWLDALAKEYCTATLREAQEKAEVRNMLTSDP